MTNPGKVIPPRRWADRSNTRSVHDGLEKRKLREEELEGRGGRSKHQQGDCNQPRTGRGMGACTVNWLANTST